MACPISVDATSQNTTAQREIDLVIGLTAQSLGQSARQPLRRCGSTDDALGLTSWHHAPVFCTLTKRLYSTVVALRPFNATDLQTLAALAGALSWSIVSLAYSTEYCLQLLGLTSLHCFRVLVLPRSKLLLRGQC